MQTQRKHGEITGYFTLTWAWPPCSWHTRIKCYLYTCAEDKPPQRFIKSHKQNPYKIPILATCHIPQFYDNGPHKAYWHKIKKSRNRGICNNTFTTRVSPCLRFTHAWTMKCAVYCPRLDLLVSEVYLRWLSVECKDVTLCLILKKGNIIDEAIWKIKIL